MTAIRTDDISPDGGRLTGLATIEDCSGFAPNILPPRGKSRSTRPARGVDPRLWGLTALPPKAPASDSAARENEP